MGGDDLMTVRHFDAYPYLFGREGFGNHIHEAFLSNQPERISIRRRSFVEPLGEFAAPYARRTARLTDLHAYVACALGGNAGARNASGKPTVTEIKTVLASKIKRWR